MALCSMLSKSTLRRCEDPLIKFIWGNCTVPWTHHFGEPVLLLHWRGHLLALNHKFMFASWNQDICVWYLPQMVFGSILAISTGSCSSCPILFNLNDGTSRTRTIALKANMTFPVRDQMTWALHWFNCPSHQVLCLRDEQDFHDSWTEENAKLDRWRGGGAVFWVDQRGSTPEMLLRWPRVYWSIHPDWDLFVVLVDWLVRRAVAGAWGCLAGFLAVSSICASRHPKLFLARWHQAHGGSSSRSMWWTTTVIPFHGVTC